MGQHNFLTIATVALLVCGGAVGCGTSKATAERGASLSQEELKKIENKNRLLRLATTPAKIDVVFGLAQKMGPKPGEVLPQTPSEMLEILINQEFKKAQQDSRFVGAKPDESLKELSIACALKESLATTTVETKTVDTSSFSEFWTNCFQGFDPLDPGSQSASADSVFTVWRALPASSQEGLALAQLLALNKTRTASERASMNAVAVLTKDTVFAGSLSAISSDKEDLAITLVEDNGKAQAFGTLRNPDAPLNVLDAEFYLGFQAVKDVVKDPDALLKSLIHETRQRYNLVSIDEVAMPQTK